MASQRPSLPEQTSSKASAAYEWNRLTNEDEIRLLLLKPGSPHDDLECEIVNVRISDNPRYEAMSYAWESENLPRTITCSNRQLRITENLFSALRSFRLPTSDRILWVDAICINQRDLNEKAEQVRLMGRIFKTAQRVCVWLGEATADEALAYACIQHAEKYGERHSIFTALRGGNTASTAAAAARRRKCMAGLFRRRYFRRLWIVQEVAQATAAVIYCGSLSMPFKTFMDGLQQLTTESLITLLDGEVSGAADAAGPAPVLPSRGLRTLKTVRDFRDDLEHSGGINLASLLAMTRHCEVTDPRDRIFALLSLSDNETLARPFAIDYTISATEIFSRLAEWFYTTRGLGFMSFANASTRPQILQSPSWVPNWTDAQTCRPLWDYTRQFAAGGQGSALGFVAPKGVLNINGKPVDSIASIIEHPLSIAKSTTLNDPDARRRAFEARAAFFDSSKALCQQLWSCTDFSAADTERYWRTMVANTHYGGAPALDLEGQAFREYDAYVHLTDEERRTGIVNAAMQSAGGMLVYPPPPVLEFESMHEIVAAGRVFISSRDRDSIGWAPYGSREGDMIVVFEGGEIPFVIRPVTEDTVVLVGECYLHGIMFGEAWADTGLGKGLFKLV